MREIRFRAWDGFMMTNSGIMFNNTKGAIESANDMPVMQYTGLKDKEGVEMYVSDIVEFVGGTCDFLPCGTYNNQRIEIGELLTVKHLLSGFTLGKILLHNKDMPNLVGHVDNYMFWSHQSSLKIIGNIFENPKLLE